ncbi:MAG: relaxase/mobilization nuclease domain-containing protein [Clostridia bacterium]|nr:relaxase/mobilization nuclease domain-containing protein [Clostridia bacterium]
MATTSMWKVEKRLDQVIKYTTDKDKTNKENYDDNTIYKSLHNVIEYAKSNFKTEQQLYVTGVNCSEENAFKEMILTKKYFGKEKGILGFHGFQSFVKGEVTPEQAHEIGVKLAQELWGERYEVIVSTHLNTNHLHNHFVVNSVSFVDGIKYRNTVENYALMRKTSDDLCREYGLSVLDEKPCGKIDYTKYYNSYIQKTTYYTIVKDDVDFAIKQAKSYKDFESILERMEYKITIRANKLSLCKPPYKRNIRIERSFGEEYTIKNIKERIENSDMNKIPFPEAYSKFKKYRYKGRNKKIIRKDRGSFYRLYLYYCYLLKVFPNTPKRVVLSDSMKQEVKKMERMSDEIKFLVRNNIKTSEELFLYKKNLTDELNLLLKNRTSLRNKKQRLKAPEEKQKITNEILVLSDKINYLKREVEFCESVKERSQKIKSNIKEIEQKEQELNNEKRKERSKNEYSR